MKLSITDSGAGPAHTLIFLHGFPFNQSMWKSQAALCRPHFRVITYDQRGHGQSESGAGQYAFESFVDDLFDILDARHIKQAILCGLSMGGYVALRAIERAPERINGLMLCDTRSEADSNEAKIKRAASVKTIEMQGASIFCEGFLKAVLTPETVLSKPQIVDQVRQMILGNTPTGMIGTLLAMAGRTDTTDSLGHIKAPTLILVGEKDPVTPPAAAESLHQRIPGSQMAVIPNAAHLSNLENPESFNRHFMSFLSSLRT